MPNEGVDDGNIAAGYILVGPTASGKSEIAQRIAEQTRRCILSADSMLVYRDMNLGTAKPSPGERGNVDYLGIDLARPDESFSVGRYLELVGAGLSAEGSPDEIIVVGGTGLYIRALLEGLPGSRPPDEGVRAQAQDIFRQGGLEALQNALRETDPERMMTLQDPMNARRVQRALEFALAKMSQPRRSEKPAHAAVPGLRYPREVLAERIRLRTQGMFDAGLVDEVRCLRSVYTGLSAAAGAGIGYEEASGVVDGRLTMKEAVEKTAARTRRLAKRQMTWFNHQAHVQWVDISMEDTPATIAQRVQEVWSLSGPLPLVGLHP